MVFLVNGNKYYADEVTINREAWRILSVHSLINTLPLEGILPSGVLNGTSSRSALALEPLAYAYCWYHSKTRTEWTCCSLYSQVLPPPFPHNVVILCFTFPLTPLFLHSQQLSDFACTQQGCNSIPVEMLSWTFISSSVSFLILCLSRALIICISLSTFSVLQTLVNEIHTQEAQ